uniref:At1g61320/AtMIF1 LRR domain-containing protein n=1 Tax=Aegilops tauschii TaxID=37682 RepID=M8BI81_AEGTA
MDLARKTDHILKNHSSIGFKALKLEIWNFPLFSTLCDLDRWLHIAVKPGIEELDLQIYESRAVRITGEELSCLLSCSVALEKLTLKSCDELIFLEIPSLPQRLSHLVVAHCTNLEAIKIKAPNLYSFDYSGALIPLSLGDSLQNLYIDALLGRQDVVHYPWADLLRMVPHLEDLEITSYCPVDADHVRQESVFGESSHDLRQMPGHMHRNIKDVLSIGFCSAKSMVELTCHMLENAKSLEYLTLNTSSDHEILCSNSKNGRCQPMSKDVRMEARKALFAVERYILGKVPSTVKLEVVKPCSRCNTLEI